MSDGHGPGGPRFWPTRVSSSLSAPTHTESKTGLGACDAAMGAVVPADTSRSSLPRPVP